MFGLLGQRKVGLSVRGGVATPKPRPMPIGGKMEVGVLPLLLVCVRRVVLPAGGMPGGPRGGESTPGRLEEPTELVWEVGRLGARPPRPRLVELPRDEDVWLAGPEDDWPTGYISNLILKPFGFQVGAE